MHKRFIRKLKSNKGASLSMALLLFLVCAAIGAVILTAATASAGRLSSLAEMDQRYYSVSSAAELLEQELTGKTVIVYRKSVKTSKSIITDTTTDLDPEYEYTFEINGENATDAASFLSQRAKHLVFGDVDLNNHDNEAGLREAMNGLMTHADTRGGSFKVSHTDDFSDLDAEVRWSMKSDGTLVFKISNVSDGEGNKNNNKYTLVLTLIPTVTEDKNSIESEPVITPIENTANAYYKIVTTTTEKTAWITWQFGGIIKEVSGQND